MEDMKSVLIPKKDSVLIIGGQGFVGSEYINYSKKNGCFIVPNHKIIDIVNYPELKEYIVKTKPSCIVNFAAITNMDESEKERGDRNGKTWNVNVEGVKNLVEICRKHNIFYIQISTDAVFPGTSEDPGPYSENHKPPKNGKGLNWYGCTKLKAEEEVKKLKKNYAIVRISHPFGNLNQKRDLVNKTIEAINICNKIFTDQVFTPTFIPDLAKALDTIQTEQLQGIFHVGCKNPIDRFTFALYLAQKFKLNKKLIKGSMKQFLRQTHRAPRTRLGGLSCEKTEQELGLQFHTWQEALDLLACEKIL